MNIDQPLNALPYTVTFENRQDYLYASVVTTKNKPEVLIAYWRAIADAVNERSARRLLVEKGSAPEASTADAFTVAAALREMGFDGIPIALVKHAAVTAESQRFVENVARNRGVMMSIFENVADAESWLRKT